MTVASAAAESDPAAATTPAQLDAAGSGAAGSTTGRAAVVEPGQGRVFRFGVTERVVHWTTAVAMVLLVATGLVLYVGPLSGVVGRRETVRMIHVWSGFALAVPLLVGVFGPWRSGLVRDLQRLGRWTRDDKRWFMSRHARAAQRTDPASANVGKFNAGQKLFAALIGGAIPVMLASGSIMHWFNAFSLDLRTGATFVHDWVAIGLFIAVPAHIVKALSEPTMLRAMVRGWVPERWAAVHRPRWDTNGSEAPTMGGPDLTQETIRGRAHRRDLQPQGTHGRARRRR